MPNHNDDQIKRVSLCEQEMLNIWNRDRNQILRAALANKHPNFKKLKTVQGVKGEKLFGGFRPGGGHDSGGMYGG